MLPLILVELDDAGLVVFELFVECAPAEQLLSNEDFVEYCTDAKNVNFAVVAVVKEHLRGHVANRTALLGEFLVVVLDDGCETEVSNFNVPVLLDCLLVRAH